jgi:hypothetical protein
MQNMMCVPKAGDDEHGSEKSKAPRVQSMRIVIYPCRAAIRGLRVMYVEIISYNVII